MAATATLRAGTPDSAGWVLPVPEEPPDDVHVQAERQRVVVDVPQRQRRLPDPGRSVQQHQSRRGTTLARQGRKTGGRADAVRAG